MYIYIYLSPHILLYTCIYSYVCIYHYLYIHHHRYHRTLVTIYKMAADLYEILRAKK